VIYLANPCTDAIRDAMTAGQLGCMASPRQGNRIDPAWIWAADNDAFTDAFTAGRWITFLERSRPLQDRCLFAAVPDRLAQATETFRRWRVYAPIVAELGYRPAFVLQDDATDDEIPWAEMGYLFIGGSTEYKTGEMAWRYAAEARRRGIPVHWGRVNSRRRFAMAALDGDSCDGTYLTYGPDTNLPRLLAWTNILRFDPPLRERSA
jgi:hypothetical protein